MSEYAHNPVYGARQYEILVAQKADPRIEVQHLDDACWVLRFSDTQAGKLGIQVFARPAAGPETAVEETLVHAARHAMWNDQHDAPFETVRQAIEITSEEYWQEVAHLARAMTGFYDRSDPGNWRDYLYRHPKTPHPMLHGVQRGLDVLRHTAHAEEYPKHVSGFSSMMSLFHFVADAASWAMAADCAEQASGSILYRPNLGQRMSEASRLRRNSGRR